MTAEFSIPANATLPGSVPVVIVGAGPVGMTLALDLSRYGIRSVLLDDDEKLCDGSRAIVIQRNPLEIWDRLGVVRPMTEKGVRLRRGRVFFRGMELIQKTLPDEGEYFPPYINLQQFYVEHFLLQALRKQTQCSIFFLHKVTGLEETDSGVTVLAETPNGPRQIQAAYVIAADGARSAVRHLCGIEFAGKTYSDRFVIADIRADLEQPPNERWFYFDPVFNPGKSALIHPQPDNTWRMDWQIGPGAAEEDATNPATVERLVRSTIGNRPFEVVWATTYVFHQRLATRFKHGRVFLAGDAAHLVSPFGARGMNSGIQDAYNLVWKLWLVMTERAGEALLDTYESERRAAARENLQVTDKTMAFMSPQTAWTRWRRNAILKASVYFKPARRLVDAGKLAQPFIYRKSPIVDGRLHWPKFWELLASPGLLSAAWRFRRGPAAGAAAPDAQFAPDFKPDSPKRVGDLIGPHLLVLYFHKEQETARLELEGALQDSPHGVPVRAFIVTQDFSTKDSGNAIGHVWDKSGEVARKYRAVAGTLYILRPDGHIAERGLKFSLSQLAASLRRAIGSELASAGPQERNRVAAA